MSFTEIMAWSAASNAESAARDAEYAANQARESAEDLEYSRVLRERSQTMNKILQDIFYGREVDFFKISEIKKNIKGYNSNRSLFRINNNYSFPYIALFFSIALSFMLFKSFNIDDYSKMSIFIIISNIIFFLLKIRQTKDWIWWKKNKKRLEEERLQKIDNLYRVPMRNLAKEFYMLSRTGIVRKYRIDKTVEETYTILKNENKTQAKKALLKLYYLLFEFSDDNFKFNSDAEQQLTNIFIKDEEIRTLDTKNMLFLKEALDIFDEEKN